MEEREELKSRYQLAIARIEEIENEGLKKENRKFSEYFICVSNFLKQIKEILLLVQEETLYKLSLEELEELNTNLFCSLTQEDNYQKSYLNPTYAVDKLGEKYGKMFSFLYAELFGLIAYAFENRIFEITITLELFIEIYNIMEYEEKKTEEAVACAIYYHFSDYSDVLMENRIRETLDPSCSFAKELILNTDLNDLRYLYYFGEYISKNEIELAAYLNRLPQKQIDAMAKTYTEGFRLGFIHSGIDLSKKKTVNIRYCLGFERIVKAAIEQFKQMGLSVIIYRAAVSSIHKKKQLKIGYYATSPNKQFDYDHRFDEGIYFNKAFVERKLEALRTAYEKYKDLAKVYAGPALIEIFGEKPFSPIAKGECINLTSKQETQSIYYHTKASLITNQYIKSEEYSFTIIAYPIPDIGKDFKQIFEETRKVNMLDMEKYKNIQQCLIKVLEKGEYVQVIGKGENKTNIKVMLYPPKDLGKETNFENCLADVNIPVGEVFTSPKLKGTCGLLHVTEVYLESLRYNNLKLYFKDGEISDYSCKNFQLEEENKKFIKENLLYHHQTLPLGEFAIGTNTTAYQMGRKYNISHILPILIAEKTGPHFAIGDTCYKMSEDLAVYNPDGREIIAKDNEYSILRKTDLEKAYFNCHTDITIPYDELGEISVYTKEGEKTILIQDGRFVLEGTKELNEALD